nr:MAG TPA: hypothetical protein [Bacteriophage sp.]
MYKKSHKASKQAACSRLAYSNMISLKLSLAK